MSRKSAEILLTLVTLGWGSSYMFMKLGLGSLSEASLIALRFGIAFIATLPILIKRRKQMRLVDLGFGGLLGLLLFTLFIALLNGLRTTTTSNAGFLVGLTVVFVPLLEMAATRKRPSGQLTLGIVLALAGIASLSLKSSFAIHPGDWLCILASIVFALHIMATNTASRKGDSLSIGIIQLGVASLLGIIASLVTDTVTIPQSRESWGAVLALGLVCSAFGFVGQTLAQQHTSASRTGIIISLQPVFAGAFGILLLGEPFGMREWIGAALILASIFVSSKPHHEKKRVRTSIS